jgi:DHA1 family bicyclomycin/chloramphenicol resistance-like MFS transporter
MSDPDSTAPDAGRPNAASVAPPTRRPSLAILIALSAIGPLALNIFVPSMPGLQATFGVSYAVAQLTLTLYLIGTAVCQLIYGPLSDRYGRRPVILVGQGIFVLASLAAAMAPTIEVLIAARAVQAVGGAAGIVISRAIVRDLYGREKSASVLGYLTVAWVLAPMLAPSIGGLLDGIGGWSASFYFLTVVGAGVWFAALAGLHETHFARETVPILSGFVIGFKALLRVPKFMAYTLTLAFGSGVFFSFLAGAPYIVVVVLDRSPLEYGLWFMVVSLGYMAGNALAGRFSERIGIDRMIGFGVASVLSGSVISMTLVLAGVHSPLAIFLPMILVALGNGLSLPNGIAGAMSINPALAGTAAGLAGFMQMGLGAALSQSVGAAQVLSPWASLYVMAASAALSLLAYRWILTSITEGTHKS